MDKCVQIHIFVSLNSLRSPKVLFSSTFFLKRNEFAAHQFPYLIPLHTIMTFLSILLMLPSVTAAAPLTSNTAATTVGKIRGVRDPIYHLYLQASPANSSIPVLGSESTAEEFTIGGTIQSKKTSKYLNIQTASKSYKPLVWDDSGATTAWGLEGDTIITVQGSSYGRRKLGARLR